jgi:hypothetical protein
MERGSVVISLRTAGAGEQAGRKGSTTVTAIISVLPIVDFNGNLITPLLQAFMDYYITFRGIFGK